MSMKQTMKNAGSALVAVVALAGAPQNANAFSHGAPVHPLSVIGLAAIGVGAVAHFKRKHKGPGNDLH